jgi:hypothetical protein
MSRFLGAPPSGREGPGGPLLKGGSKWLKLSKISAFLENVLPARQASQTLRAGKFDGLPESFVRCTMSHIRAWNPARSADAANYDAGRRP